MNYRNLHDAIINNARNRSLQNVYTEVHHIIPKSLGGSNLKDNLVRLTAKEHFVVHHLLWKIYNNKQMTSAFMLMCHVKRNGTRFTISSKEYTKLKEENSKYKSDYMSSKPGPNLGKVFSQDWKNNIGKAQLGNCKGKSHPSNFKGKTHTNESKEILSAKLKGNKNRIGKMHTEETKNSMSDKRKGKSKEPWSEQRKAARSIMMRELWKSRQTKRDSEESLF